MKINATEAIKTIKSLLGFEDLPSAPDTSAPMELKQYTTDNGVVVNIDRLEVGGKVTQEDGTPVAGDITLADGTVISIDMEGNITNIVVPAPVEAQNEVPAPVAPVAMEAVEARFAAQEQSFKELLKAEQEARQKDAQTFTEVAKQMLALVQQLAAEPADEPIQKPTNEAGLSKRERAAALMNAARFSAAAKATV